MIRGPARHARRVGLSLARLVSARGAWPATRPMDNGDVPQSERQNEIQAKEFLQEQLGVELIHSDTNGGVDYTFTLTDGSSGAVEITTVTDSDAKRDLDAWMRYRDRAVPAPSLENCWHVTVHSGTRFSGLSERLEPALAALEAIGVDLFREWTRLDLVGGSAAPASEAVQILAADGVVEARVFPTRDEHPSHRIYVGMMGGWTARGSTDALSRIEQALRGKPDNARKLVEANADSAHLFVWLDDDTPGEISRPFAGGYEDWDHFGLPERPPELPDPITNLWVLHRTTLRGWRWSPTQGWTALGPPAQDSTQATS